MKTAGCCFFGFDIYFGTFLYVSHYPESILNDIFWYYNCFCLLFNVFIFFDFFLNHFSFCFQNIWFAFFVWNDFDIKYWILKCDIFFQAFLEKSHEAESILDNMFWILCFIFFHFFIFLANMCFIWICFDWFLFYFVLVGLVFLFINIRLFYFLVVYLV